MELRDVRFSSTFQLIEACFIGCNLEDWLGQCGVFLPFALMTQY